MASAPKRSTDPRFVRTRQALRAALLRTLDRFELAQVTIQMIVAEAGIGRATFFRHFASVDALLITVAETMIGEIVQRLGPALLKGDREAVLELAATYIAEQRRPIAAILIGGGERTRKEITDRAIARAADLPLALDPLRMGHAHPGAEAQADAHAHHLVRVLAEPVLLRLPLPLPLPLLLLPRRAAAQTGLAAMC